MTRRQHNGNMIVSCNMMPQNPVRVTLCVKSSCQRSGHEILDRTLFHLSLVWERCLEQYGRAWPRVGFMRPCKQKPENNDIIIYIMIHTTLMTVNPISFSSIAPAACGRFCLASTILRRVCFCHLSFFDLSSCLLGYLSVLTFSL